MSPYFLAFSAEDADRVAALLLRRPATVSVERVAVEREAGASSLIDRLNDTPSPVLLLISDAFLRNPNCLVGLAIFLEQRTDRITLIAGSEELAASLRQQAQRMTYVRYWEERYIDLRRDTASYAGQEKEAFTHYLAKIRDVSTSIDEILLALDKQQLQQIDTFDFPRVAVDRQGVAHAWKLAEAGDRAGAQVQWKLVNEQSGEDPEVGYEYALFTVLEENDLPKARRLLDELLGRIGFHADAVYLSGEIKQALGQYAAAREDWERLYDHDPNYTGLDVQLATLLADHFPGTEAEAAALFKRASKRRSATADTYYRYGRLLDSAFGKRKKATKQLRRATELDPDFAAAHYRLAVWQFEAGESEQARNHYILASTLDTRYATAENQQAFLHLTPHTQQPTPNTPPPNTQSPHTPPPPPMQDPLASLKQNIAHLEELLSERKETAPASAPQKSLPGTGKTVFISGASSGIGRATARRLARSGYRLILNGRREERLGELREELRQHDIDIHLLPLDVRDREGVKQLIDELPQDWRSIDILINNAGKAKGFDPIHEGSIDHWEEMIDVNLKGLLYLTRAITPGMVERQSGMIINVASTAGKEVYPKGNVYCATKHGVDALTYAMRLDLVEHGIRVGQICPAHVEETEFALVRFDGDSQRAKIYDDFQPLRSADVAEAIHFMVTQPPHVNVMDMVLQGSQQASSTVVDRSGRDAVNSQV